MGRRILLLRGDVANRWGEDYYKSQIVTGGEIQPSGQEA